MQHAENESDDDDAEWESFNEPEVAPTVDLFSDRVFESAAAALAHAKAAHGLDLASIAFGLKLDIYGRVRLVNYVRSRAAAADESAAIVKSVKEGASSSNGATWPWADDKFLVPVLPEDPLLYSLGAPTSGGDQQHGDQQHGEQQDGKCTASSSTASSTARLENSRAIVGCVRSSVRVHAHFRKNVLIAIQCIMCAFDSRIQAQ